MQANSISNARNRLLELDSLRGWAACYVMLHHFTWSYETQHNGHPIDPIIFLKGGNFAVWLFFMISGFVISWSTDRRPVVKDFIVSRFARLFPAYWGSIAIAVLLGYHVTLPGDLDKVAANLTMCQTVLGYDDINPVYWSLWIELIFYAVIAFSLAIHRKHWVIWILTGLMMIDILAVCRCQWDRVPGWWRFLIYFPLLRHLPFFVYGMWLARREQVSPRVLILVSFLCLFSRYSRGATALDLLIIAALGASLWLAVAKKLPYFANPVFVWLGTISYSLYLTHQCVGFFVIDTAYHFHVPVHGTILLASLASMGTAAILTFLIEQPSNRWILDVWKRRNSPTNQPTSKQ